MDEWAYFKTIVTNYKGLFGYYFTALQHYAPGFRQAGVGLIYSIGLAWIAVTAIKSPVDRFKAAGGAAATLILAAFLLSPTTNIKFLKSSSTTELSIGGYYSFYVLDSIMDVFRSTLDKVWLATNKEAALGGAGPASDSLAIAFADKSAAFAEKFRLGPARGAYIDYSTKCAPEIAKRSRTFEDKRSASAIGAGGNTLGVNSKDISIMAEVEAKRAAGNASLGDELVSGLDTVTFGLTGAVANWKDQGYFEDDRQAGIELLKNIPDENNPITGSSGYKIPTTAHFKAATLDEGESNEFQTRAELGEPFSQMNNGVSNGPSESEENLVVYPKNCYELYMVAQQTMTNFRDAVREDPEFKDLTVAQSYAAIMAGVTLDKAIRDQAMAASEAAGYETPLRSSVFNTLGTVTMNAFSAVGVWFKKWMLGFKIPALIASMALMSVALIICFPIFALLSVVFGPRILVTYLKMCALPIIVVFINDMMLTMAANLIAYNNIHQLAVDTFHPNSTDAPASLAATYTEVIVYSLLTAAELAIAKLLIFDDYRAASTMSPSETVTNTASTGAGIAASVAAIPATAGRLALTGSKLSAISSGRGNPTFRAPATPPLPSGGGFGGGGGGGGGGGNTGSAISTSLNALSATKTGKNYSEGTGSSPSGSKLVPPK